jgi:DNA modification methylase
MHTRRVNIELWQGDCLELMHQIPDGSIDMVLADLPYGTTACKWDSVIPFEPLWTHYRRLIKPRGAIVLFASQPFTSALVMSNPDWFRHEWIWSKSNGGGFLNANRAPLKRHESVIVFSESQPIYRPQFTRGKPYACRSSAAGGTTFDQTVAGWVTQNDGHRFPVTIQHYPNETGLHPTQKPVDLLAYLIRTYTNEGETVLDNTMGSGSTGVACIQTGREFIGIEKDAGYFQIAQRRIMATPRQFELAI